MLQGKGEEKPLPSRRSQSTWGRTCLNYSLPLFFSHPLTSDWVVLANKGCHSKVPPTEWPETTAIPVSWLWKVEVPIKVSAGSHALKVLGDDPSLHIPSFGISQQSLLFLGL